MPIIFEYQTCIECDNCGSGFAQMLLQKKVIQNARIEGWKIGKRVLCSKCAKNKKENKK